MIAVSAQLKWLNRSDYKSHFKENAAQFTCEKQVKTKQRIYVIVQII